MWNRILLTAAISGTFGSVVSTGALGVLARTEGHGALRPTNATSHWLHGSQASNVTRLDWTHTGIGAATHAAATLFWAGGYAWWSASQPRLPPRTALAGAVLTAAVAAAVDYGATPKRFTPGWEHVLSKRAMAVAYLAMAAGLAAGGLLAHRLTRAPD